MHSWLRCLAAQPFRRMAVTALFAAAGSNDGAFFFAFDSRHLSSQRSVSGEHNGGRSQRLPRESLKTAAVAAAAAAAPKFT